VHHILLPVRPYHSSTHLFSFITLTHTRFFVINWSSSLELLTPSPAQRKFKDKWGRIFLPARWLCVKVLDYWAQHLIPVLGSQPPGDASHKPGGGLPLHSARPIVTFPTHRPVPISLLGEQRQDMCEHFCDCYRTALWLRFEPRLFCTWVQHANHSATKPPFVLPNIIKTPGKFCQQTSSSLDLPTDSWGKNVNPYSSSLTLLSSSPLWHNK